MGAHVLDLELQLLLRPPRGALLDERIRSVGGLRHALELRGREGELAGPSVYLICIRTLKARCSRKWAVPLVSAVSAREPASIQTPTVEVWA